MGLKILCVLKVYLQIILSIFRVNLSAAVRLLRKHSRFEKDGAIQQICFFLESFQTFLEQSLPNPTAFLDVQRVSTLI